MGLTDFKVKLGIDELRAVLRFQKTFANRNKLDISTRLFELGKMSEEEYTKILMDLLESEGGLLKNENK